MIEDLPRLALSGASSPENANPDYADRTCDAHERPCCYSVVLLGGDSEVHADHGAFRDGHGDEGEHRDGVLILHG